MKEDCTEICKKDNKPCENKECKYWLDYPNELNCTFVTIERNGCLTLRERADRMGVSFVRIKQIEDRALRRIKESEAAKYLQEEMV